MNDFVATLVPALGQALVQFLWQGAAIGALAAIALRLLRDASPQARYLVACLALLACVVAPVYSVVSQFGDVAPATQSAPGFHRVQEINFAGDGATPTLQARVDAWFSFMTSSAMTPAIVAAWAAGASVFCLRTLFGAAWLRRIRRVPQPPLQATWQARLDAIARRMRVRDVALRLVETLDSPVVAGWWRPVVLLPTAVALRMPADLVEALLAHELAHVRRHDYLVNLLQRVVEALLFYHPVTWWLSRRVRIEREHVADRLAADAIGEPRRLAVALAALSDLQRPAPTAVPHLAHAAHGGHLMSRIQQLLHPAAPRAPAGRIALPLLGIAAACIAFVAQAQIGRDATPAVAATPAVSATPAVAAASIAAPAVDASPAVDATPAVETTPAVDATPRVAPTPMVQVAQATSIRQVRDHDDGHTFALVRHGQDGYTMSGSTRDIEQIDAVKRMLRNDFLWFRRDGKAYVIDDPSTVARAQAAWKDSELLGDKMEGLGKQMEVHGKKMEGLGAQMEKLSGDRVPSPRLEAASDRMEDLAAQQQELAGKQMKLAQKQRKAEGKDADDLDAQMDVLSKQMDALSGKMEAQGRIIESESAVLQKNAEPMEALSRQMHEASKPMDDLGRQMNVLGKQQEQLSRKAMLDTERLIVEAMKQGLAKPSPVVQSR